MENNDFMIELSALLNQSKSRKQINSDIKALEQTLNALKLTATFAKADTKRELNTYIKQLGDQLAIVKLHAKVDQAQLKREINNSLKNVQLSDINIKEHGVGLKLRKVYTDFKRQTEKEPVTIDFTTKKQTLQNQLTTYLSKNSKVRESSILLEEADKLRNMFDNIDSKESLKQATEQLRLFKSECTATSYVGKSTTDKIGDLVKGVARIGSAFGVANIAVQNFQKSLQTLKSNDTILTEISKTSEMNKTQLTELGDSSFDTASKYGQLSSNYLLGVQEMARSGYEETSKDLGKLSLLAQSAGDMTADMANNYLLATDAAYKYSGSIEKLNAALDGANYISNKNSASLTDIADAIRVSASFAANAGVEVDELTAAESTMIATTKRSGSEMGRAFRSIILNLQGVSGEFDGEVIDEEQLEKVEKRCHSLGVELEYMQDGMATLRNPMEILKDLSEVYNSLPDNSADKQGLIRDLGGKYHANALSALLSRWDLYEKMLSEYSQGAGSSLVEAEKTANSWEGKLNSLQNSWDSFVNTLTNKDAIVGGISIFDNMIQGATKLIDVLGALPVLLTTINAGVTALQKDYGITQVVNKDTKKLDIQGNIFGIDFTAIKSQKQHFIDAESAIAKWNERLKVGKSDINDFNESVVKNSAQLKEYLETCSKDAPASLEGYKAFLHAAGESTDALRLKTVLLNSALTLVTSIGIQGAITLFSKLATSHQEMIDTLNSTAQSFNEENQSIEENKAKIIELKTALDSGNLSYSDAASKRDELLTIQSSLIESYGSEAEGIDLVNGSLEEQIALLDEVNNKKLQEAVNKANEYNTGQKVANVGENFSRYLRNIFNGDFSKEAWNWDNNALGSNLQQATAEMEGFSAEFKALDNENLNKIIESFKEISRLGDIFYIRGNAEDVKNTITEMQEQLGTSSYYTDELNSQLTDIYNKADNISSNYQEGYNLAKMQQIANDETLSGYYNDITDAYNAYKNAVTNGDKEMEQQSLQDYSELLQKISSDDSVENSMFRYFTEMYPELKSEVENWKFNTKVTPELDVTDSDINSDIEKLSTFTIEDLSQKYTDIINGTSGGLTDIQLEALFNLQELADECGLTLDELLVKLNEAGKLQSQEKQDDTIETPSIDQTPIKTFTQAWAELGDTADENLKGVQKELLKLAETGMLSADSLKEIEGAEEYFNNIGLSAQEASNKINELVTTSSQLSSMRTGITSITGALSEKQSDNIVSADTLGKFDVSLQGLESWQEFEETLGNSKSSIEECRQAANNLATEYVNSNNFLAHLTETNKDYYVSQLSNMGVTNALEVVNAQLANSENALAVAQSEVTKYSESLTDSKERNRIASIDLANASASDIQALYNEATASGVATNGLRQLLAQKYNANNLAVSTAADCANLAQLYSQSLSTAKALNTLAQAKAAASSGKYIPPQQLELMTKSAQNAINTENKKTQVAPQVQVSGGSSGGGGGSSKAKESKTKIDWIARKLERLQKKIDATKAKFENLFTVKAKSSNLDKQIKQTNSLLKANEKAAKKYKTYMGKVKLSASLKKKVREGNYSISDYSSKTAEKINKYKEYYDNYKEAAQKTDELKTSIRKLREEQYQLYVDDAEAKIEKANAQKDIAKGYKDQNKYIDEQKAYLKQSYDYQIKIAKLSNDKVKQAQLQAEYEQELRELEKEKFDNIEKYYENQVKLIELSQKKIEDRIELLEAKGMMINARYYEAEIAYQKDMRSQYEASQKELQNQLTAMENAALRGTEEWYDAVEALNEVNSNITECDTSIAEMNNSITDVANTIHEKLLSSLASVSDEMDWIAGLMNEKNMFNEDDGAFTKEGLATLGTYVSGLNTSKYSATVSKGLAEEMQKALDSNKLEFTFNEQSYKFNSKEQLENAIEDVNETWRDQITETYEYSNKIIDMMVEKLESEISALKELIEKKKKALDAEKALRDYQNSIKESTDNVASLQKQIAAIQGDTSEEGTMRIQKLQKELSDAQSDLKEKETDRALQDHQDMLDKLMEEYESLINAETQNRDALLQKGIDAVKLSADSIKNTIDKYADKYDYTDVLDNIQSGLMTMTGNDSALNQIKTSVLSSIEPTGTLPSAITGLKLSIMNGLSNISSQLDQLLKERAGTTSNTTTHSAVPPKSEPVLTLINRVHGFSKGGVVPVDDIEKQVKANGDTVLVSANPGEGFLTPVQTDMFQNFVDNGLQDLVSASNMLQPLITMPKMPEAQPVNRDTNKIVNIDNITLPNVTNYRQFKTQMFHDMQSDKKFNALIKDMSVNQLVNAGRLAKQRQKL